MECEIPSPYTWEKPIYDLLIDDKAINVNSLDSLNRFIKNRGL